MGTRGEMMQEEDSHTYVDVASNNIANEDGASNLAESRESGKRKTTLGGGPKRSFDPTVTSTYQYRTIVRHK
ncbi:hypothetical protein Unana1_01648 [Umbelopsis nana]